MVSKEIFKLPQPRSKFLSLEVDDSNVLFLFGVEADDDDDDAAAADDDDDVDDFGASAHRADT